MVLSRSQSHFKIWERLEKVREDEGSLLLKKCFNEVKFLDFCVLFGKKDLKVPKNQAGQEENGELLLGSSQGIVI